MKQNEYFNEMYRIGCEWQKRHDAHEKRKKEIIETLGWESPELEAWYAEEEQMKFPFSSGANKAYRAWRYSDGDGEHCDHSDDGIHSDEVEMTDFCWEGEYADFIGTLRKAGIKSFVVTNRSTGLMEDIHNYIDHGCTLEGPCTIIRKKESFGEETEETVLGLRFRL